MKQFVCERCGGIDFMDQNGYRTCKYCGSKYMIQIQEVRQKGSSIDLSDDIKKLLAKCREDPKNAYRYANLILDIDPNNIEARKYQKRNRR